MHHTYKNWWNECLPFIHTWHILPHPPIHLPTWLRSSVRSSVRSSIQSISRLRSKTRAYITVHIYIYVYRMKRDLTFIDTSTHSNHAMQANVSEEEGLFFLQHIEEPQSTTQKLAALGTPMLNCQAAGFRSVPCQSRGIDRKQDRSRRSELHRSNVVHGPVHGWKTPRNLVGQTSKPLALAT